MLVLSIFSCPIFFLSFMLPFSFFILSFLYFTFHFYPFHLLALYFHSVRRAMMHPYSGERDFSQTAFSRSFSTFSLWCTRFPHFPVFIIFFMHFLLLFHSTVVFLYIPSLLYPVIFSMNLRVETFGLSLATAVTSWEYLLMISLFHRNSTIRCQINAARSEILCRHVAL